MKYIIFILFFSILSKPIWGQSSKIPSEKPKLVVGIVVDLMRYDYILKYWDKMENNGIKRLVNEGSFCKNAHYNYIFNTSSVGFATIGSGANPGVHGIVAETWYAPLTDKEVYSTVADNGSLVGTDSKEPVYTSEKLLVSTFSDELKMATFKKSVVISVSINGATSVISAGHLANAAYWYDTNTGNWITSNKYMSAIPKWVDEFNRKDLATTYLNRNWETVRPIAEYTESLADDNAYEIGLKSQKTFPYNLSAISLPLGTTKRNYDLLKFTPFGNSLTKDFAISAMVNEKMGQDDITDYLCINFSSTEYISKLFGIHSVETQDAYLRLDKEIKHFLDFIDTYVGKGNTLIFFTSNHGSAFNPMLMSEMGVPSGTFNHEQAMKLLQSYLNIVYGKGNWIKLYKGQQIYLNRELIENSKLDLKSFQETVSNFCLQFTGVANVATAYQLQYENYTSGVFKKMQNSFNHKRSGDIMINLEAGWTEKDDSYAGHNTGYSYDTHVPLVFYGWKINRQTIHDPVDMIDIAPTISTFLDIAYPNGCQGKPIEKLFR